ncbi:sensor histidine kinase [Noviherbaspirillum massiliense]|uniref:sensor histidine kinase n=1 Tax=Noviherbaspirillum massiliense TaxID=1465823 RepID=UPI00031394C5|nr:ATP-binding protein [Noviherbaspirillum massiliense]
MKREAASNLVAPRDTLWRTLQTFCVTRIVIAFVLLIFIFFNLKGGGEQGNHLLDWDTCLVYLLVAIGFAAAASYFRRRFLFQLTSQVTADIVVISMLYILAGGAKSGLAILYLFPLSGGAILAPLVLALFFASVVTLILLAVAGYQILYAAIDATMLQPGLYGAAFFAAVFVTNRLAARLINQETLAVQRGNDLRVQEAINRLVIADMDDGILVIERDTTVLAGNPAAERMLGLILSGGRARDRLADNPSLAPIAEAFFSWANVLHGKPAAEAPVFVMIKPLDEVTTLQMGASYRDVRRELGSRLQLRFVPVETGDLADERTVIFLQDVTEIENRAQELKLASMGRLTASIAHEVRNPLSAISHAASLMAEEEGSPTQARLLKIVGDNVARLNRLIEDILKLSRKAQSSSEPIDLAAFCADILNEFRDAHAVRPGLIRMDDMRHYRVRFDPLHLREVIVNLLSNSLRYASGRDGSIRIRLVAEVANRLELHVQDDGPTIKPEVRAHLFEPFYTTSSKGTGLGLYVARELCLNNGAMLDYEYRADGFHEGRSEPTGRFVITFTVPAPL